MLHEAFLLPNFGTKIIFSIIRDSNLSQIESL